MVPTVIVGILLVLVGFLPVAVTVAVPQAHNTRKCKGCGAVKRLDKYEGNMPTCKACRSKKARADNKLKAASSTAATCGTCYCCKVTKTASEFTRNNNRLGGPADTCRRCHNEKTAAARTKHQAKVEQESHMTCKELTSVSEMTRISAICKACRNKAAKRRYANDLNFKIKAEMSATVPLLVVAEPWRCHISTRTLQDVCVSCRR